MLRHVKFSILRWIKIKQNFEPFVTLLTTFSNHGWLARWRKWKSCDIGEAKEGLENELWCRWSNKRGWRMSCDVDKAREGLENELWRRWSNRKLGEWQMSFDVGKVREGLENELWRRWSNGKLGEWAELILQALCCFTYIIAHSPTLLLLYLRHSSFSNHSFASPTSQAVHLIHLASRRGRERCSYCRFVDPECGSLKDLLVP